MTLLYSVIHRLKPQASNFLLMFAKIIDEVGKSNLVFRYIHRDIFHYIYIRCHDKMMPGMTNYVVTHLGKEAYYINPSPF